MSDIDNLKQLAISETGFVFDPRSGATYSLNPTARLLITGLRDGSTLDNLAALIGEEFTATSDQLRDDILDFIQSLRRNGLVSADFKVS